MTDYKIKKLISGNCNGPVYCLKPFSFWGGVEVNTGKLNQKNHPDIGFSLSNKIIAVKNFIGSSSSASVLLELIRKKIAPSAILMEDIDAIVCLASIVAENLQLSSIPMYQISNIEKLHLKNISLNENGINFEL